MSPRENIKEEKYSGGANGKEAEREKEKGRDFYPKSWRFFNSCLEAISRLKEDAASSGRKDITQRLEGDEKEIRSILDELDEEFDVRSSLKRISEIIRRYAVLSGMGITDFSPLVAENMKQLYELREELIVGSTLETNLKEEMDELLGDDAFLLQLAGEEASLEQVESIRRKIKDWAGVDE